MRAISKIILFGEHSVVYGRPAIALPVFSAYTDIMVKSSDSLLIKTDRKLDQDEKNRLYKIVEIILDTLAKPDLLKIKITSNVPIGCGMGSSASLSVAMVRSISSYYGIRLVPEKVSALAFRCEKVFHGSPSGIDNSVVAYEMPIYYEKGNIIKLDRNEPMHLLIADTGKKGITKEIVSSLKKKVLSEEEKYNIIFNKMGWIAECAHKNFKYMESNRLGELMDMNHALLQQLGVSDPMLDRLCCKAKEHGAYGAKLAGAGKGGIMITLIDPKNTDVIRKNLLSSGAVAVYEVHYGI